MIFCVEDDISIRELMVYTLKASGFEATGFDDGAGLFSEIGRIKGEGGEMPELILLDIMLPGEDGLTILKKLRRDVMTADIPIIMASAKDTEYDKVSGLDLGADDYLAKPYGMMEMVARVRAVLRRYGDKDREDEVLTGGDIEMNVPAHRVMVQGRSVELTLKEFEILRRLLQGRGQVLAREKLLREVWGMNFMGESRTIDVHMGTLRTKLGSSGIHIKTIRGIGYKFE